MKNIIYILFITSFLLPEKNYLQSNSILFVKQSNLVNEEIKIKDKTKKNQFLAMGLSAFIPGAGQIYNGDWKRGVGYLGLELLLWNYRAQYNDEGDKYVRSYKNYADEHWSFSKWIQDFYSYISVNNQDDVVTSAFTNNDMCDDFPTQQSIYENSSGYNGYCTPWHQAHSIQWIEDSNNDSVYDETPYSTKNGSQAGTLFANECGTSYWTNPNCTVDQNNFSNIQVIKDHHFYEGIGKYNLFFAGWDDTETCLNLSNGNIINSDVCRWIDSSGNALSQHKAYYQDVLRDKANESYDKAENALTIIFVNHAVSMFDAFISHIIKKSNDKMGFESEAIYDKKNLSLNGMKFNLKW